MPLVLLGRVDVGEVGVELDSKVEIGGGDVLIASSGVGYWVVDSYTIELDMTTIFFRCLFLCAQTAASNDDAVMRSFSANRS